MDVCLFESVYLQDVATEMSITKEKLAMKLASTDDVDLVALSVRFAKKNLHILLPRFGRIINVSEIVSVCAGVLRCRMLNPVV